MCLHWYNKSEVRSFLPFHGSYFWLPKLPCSLQKAAAPAACLLLCAALGLSPSSGRAGRHQASRVTLSCKQASPNLVRSGFFPFTFQLTKQYWWCTWHCPAQWWCSHFTPSSPFPQSWRHYPPGSREQKGLKRPSPVFIVLSGRFSHPAEAGRLGQNLLLREALSWGGLAAIGLLHQGISMLLGLNPPQREWDPLTGSRGLVVGQGKEMLTPPGSQTPAQSYPFTTSLTRIVEVL